MAISLTEFRANIYRLVDEAIATGRPIEIGRNGRIVRIVPEMPVAKMDRLLERNGVISGDPEELVHIDWSGDWSGNLP